MSDWEALPLARRATVAYHAPMIRTRLPVALRLLVVSLLYLLIIAPEWPAFQDEAHRLDALVDLRRFDYLVWESEALVAKISAGLTANHVYLDEASRRTLVLDYLARLEAVRSLEREIDAVFVDPAVDDPVAATAVRQAQVTAERRQLARRQGVVESIVQEQVGAILVEQGFGVLGHPWPPVEMRLTGLPSILVVSPRDEIRQKYTASLAHGLLTPTHEALETGVYEQLDLSALVVPIGGVGLFPAMIIETGNINFLADVTAHEWAHHWLSLHPLGVLYGASSDLRTINETVASIVGGEVGPAVIARYYPEMLPPPPAPPPAIADAPAPDTPPPFDFRAEMAETRVTVDALLLAGRVDEAEAYMETRRRVFVDNGYRIRKLNQAYFAFYGAYADTPGATGGDPIGPALLALRAESPTLRTFLDKVAGITSIDDLQELVAE